MDVKRYELLWEVNTYHGYYEQVGKLHEEIGELMQALNKYRKMDLENGTIEPNDFMQTTTTWLHVREELADVLNMVEGLSILLSVCDWL